VQQAQERYERFLKRRFPQSTTPKHYRNDLHLFVRHIEVQSPQKVTPADVDQFIEAQIAANLNPTTINRRLASLHTFFEFLAQEDPYQNWPNPVNHRRHRLKRGSHLPRDASESDVTRLFLHIDGPRDRAMFTLMLGAGLRVGEVAKLKLEDVQAPESGQLAKLRVHSKRDKERIVWLTSALWQTLQTWLKQRPCVPANAVFLNHHQHPLSVSGIQYRFKGHCQAAGVKLSCHQLRHTFARRLVEGGLPLNSLAKLLGHAHLQTTQLYIDGADVGVRADFEQAIAQRNSGLFQNRQRPLLKPQMKSATSCRRPGPKQLHKLRQQLTVFPAWLAEAMDVYLSWRWPTWRAQTAYHSGQNLISVMRRIWNWLSEHRQVEGWQSLHRADLELWVQACCEKGLNPQATRQYLDQFRMLLRFLHRRDYPIDSELFRVQPPRSQRKRLPRHLSETEYGCLESVVLQATGQVGYAACLDRAWFLTLAHTGVRVSEMLDLRLEDVNLEAGYITVRGTKADRDRVVYLTLPLQEALETYLKRRVKVAEDDHVFLLQPGRCPTARTILRRLDFYGQQAGVKVTPHRLRHTLATRLTNRGMPIGSLRKLLGHKHINTTQIYAHVYDETVYEQFQAAMVRVAKPLQSKMGRVLRQSIQRE